MAWKDWVRTVEIEPSLYAADFAGLGEQIVHLLNAGARIFHFDIGDGHFVPPVTIGPVVLRSIAPMVHDRGGVLDCHLMVDDPVHHFAELAESGADSVTFHVEAVEDPAAVIAAAREPARRRRAFARTEVADAAAAQGADLALCMSIEPATRARSSWRARSTGSGARLLVGADCLQVDGGVNQDNVRSAYDAGARLLVTGAIFGREDLPRSYRRLVQALA